MAEVEVNGAVKKEQEEKSEVSPKKISNDIEMEEKSTAEAEPVAIKTEDSKEASNAKTEDPTEVNNVKTEDIKEASNLEKQIIRQIEYYFGDINLPRDKFLQDQIKLDDGWIPLEIMLKFQRLANLSKDLDVIVTAISKSDNGLIEVSEDKKKIRRSPDKVLPQQTEERKKELMSQTVYCKGFPQDSSLDNLLEYFQKYGKVDSVIMRYYHDKKTKSSNFKGSAFIIFSTREKAEEFLKMEEVKYGETPLLRLWQADYLEKKKSERKPKPQKEGVKQEEQEQEAKSFPRGTVLHLKGNFGNIEREALKAVLEEKGDKVAFINYTKGEEEGWVRMQEENAAKSLVEKLEDNKLVLEEGSVEVRIVEGEEEETFLKDAMSEMLKRRNAARQNFRGRRGGRGGGRGGRGGYNQNRKRKADNAGDGPPAKEVKS
ncbi:La protein homolog [Gryllus bimaculatus]|nr:La protein homolog [Gryllus bimaculatus]